MRKMTMDSRDFKPLLFLYIVATFSSLAFLATQIPHVSAVDMVDRTLEPETSGDKVVDASVNKITSYNMNNFQDPIFTDNDQGLFRRIACVESNDGEDPGTYRSDYHGGIWQVDESNFTITKDTSTYPSLGRAIELIEMAFGIDWTSVSWEDLRKPMYSALAARLYLSISILREEVPLIGDLDGQARYWRRYYDTEADDGTREDYFKERLANCQGTINCSASDIDIVFVMDGSGSIGSVDFELAKDFVANTLDTFQIGPDMTRVGVMQYNSGQQIEIALGSVNDKAELQAKVNNIAYISGSTSTGAAIDATVSHPDLFGGNDRQIPVPRVCVVITDGQSSDGVKTPADNARNSNIVMFAVGVSGYNIDELNQIANDPDEVYRFEVPNFQTIENIRATLALTTCLASGILDALGDSFSSTYPPGGIQYLEIPIPDSGMMTFTLHTPRGKACAYLSTLLPNPNSAFYEWKLTTTEEDDFEQIVIDVSEPKGTRRKRQQSEQDLTLYVSIENTGDTDNNVTVNAEEGNTIIEEPTTRRITTLPPTTLAQPTLPPTTLPPTTLPPTTLPPTTLPPTTSPPTTSPPTTLPPTTLLPTTTPPLTGSIVDTGTTMSPATNMTESVNVVNKSRKNNGNTTIAIIVVVLILIAATVTIVVIYFLRKRSQSGSPDPTDIKFNAEIPSNEEDVEQRDGQSNQVTVNIFNNKDPSTVSFTKNVLPGDDVKYETQSKTEEVNEDVTMITDNDQGDLAQEVTVSSKSGSEDAVESSQEVDQADEGKDGEDANEGSAADETAKELEPDVNDHEPPTTN